MIKNLIDNFKNLDKLTYKIMKYGLKFCFSLCIISIIVLLTYETIYLSPFLFNIGLSLFRLSCILGIEFIVCGLVADSIKKQLI